MQAKLIIVLMALTCAILPAEAARLTVDDRASLWPRASTTDKIDFSSRMGRAFHTLSPKLDAAYFMRCLEETANIGDTKDLRLEEMVRTCISLSRDEGE
ncbi:hypothetical protein SAMN02799622_05586 [Methylobacterium sp. UNC378MF]|jgi:hypothetical protein|uniref:hypothetical protein n=1 Tax=Methylobacterium sp. UNC378MF TaxID=1502748 RepID=UPI0008848E58|nr:hypothetical protein [Methylobacterium sp. UNC378MF]SDA33720.1 hypothetical protein SAMN02799622_05586 [Methylobacterium sp. UNC378MF]